MGEPSKTLSDEAMGWAAAHVDFDGPLKLQAADVRGIAAEGYDAGVAAERERYTGMMTKAVNECRRDAGRLHGFRHIDPQEHAATVLEAVLAVVAAKDRKDQP